MATIDFTKMLTVEREQIDQRCAEIEETTQALSTERKALEERKKMLDTVGALYDESQVAIDGALETQLRLYPLSQYDDDGDDEVEPDADAYEADSAGGDAKPSLKSVS